MLTLPKGRVSAAIALILCLLLGVQFAAAEKTSPYAYTGEFRLSLDQVPFSRLGSYLSISDVSHYQPASLRAPGLYLRSAHNGGLNSFHIELLETGRAVPAEVNFTPTLLSLATPNGQVAFSFEGPDRIRVQGRGIQLRLTAAQGVAVPYPNSGWELNTDGAKYMLTRLAGVVKEEHADGSQDQGGVFTCEASTKGGTFEEEIDTYQSAWDGTTSKKTFEAAQTEERSAYRTWLNKMPSVPAELGAGAELAAYVNYGSVVHPSGNLKRPAMLMSKNWMESVWSWDQTFNAMALR